MSEPSRTFVPSTAPALIFALVTAFFLIFAVVTALALSCLLPTLFLASWLAAKAVPPARTTKATAVTRTFSKSGAYGCDSRPAPGYLVAITLAPPKVALMPLPACSFPDTTRLSLWLLVVPGSNLARRRFAAGPELDPLAQGADAGRVLEVAVGDDVVFFEFERVDGVQQQAGGDLPGGFAFGREGDVERARGSCRSRSPPG